MQVANSKDWKLIGRGAGVLLHITSLPSNYGVGTFGRSAMDFVDFLAEAGFKYWQVLPLGPTGYGDSPYQCFSSFAGNPYLIDLEMLINIGLLSKSDLADANFSDTNDCVDFGKLYQSRGAVLRKAFSKIGESHKVKIKDFFETKAKAFKSGVEDYAVFATMKLCNSAPWYEHDYGLKFCESSVLQNFKAEHFEEIEFQKFAQWLFFTQWFELKQYANSKGVNIIGDIPIYSAHDSADCWANSKCFMLDKKLMPISVGGCPPDYFSADGQLWGNPVYDWDYIKKDNWAWWVNRISANMELFDFIRLDHFRGFESYWAVPSNETTAKTGSWIKAPGISLFNALEKQLGSLPIIAEDLGLLDDAVLKLRNTTGYPGMKVLQFAFNPNAKSEYLPHNFDTTNCIAYTGTHDNSTMQGWIKSAPKPDVQFALDYLNIENADNFAFAGIHSIVSSIAKIVIAPVQDFLELDDKARMNHPAIMGGWRWRMTEDDFQILKKKTHTIKNMLKIYGRI